MQFSSILFLWFFLPISILVYYLSPKKIKNLLLVLVSLSFYFLASDSIKLTLLLLVLTLCNYLFGSILKKKNLKFKKYCLLIFISFDLLFLFIFKYWDTVLIAMNRVLHLSQPLANLILPLGISFYIFQIISFLIDTYRGDVEENKNVIDFSLYVLFFPKLLMGPIVQYKDMASQIKERSVDSEKFAYGIKRFIYGLAKKVIIADALANPVADIFQYNLSSLSLVTIWMGVILFSLQLYYDFSGYSDMAIGISKIFGFDIKENFNYPYVSKSIQEFWRRWHISLSTWFKEYVYIPLGGNRVSKYRIYINLSIVFILTGIWHGATFNFWLWGIFHGFFMFLERAFLGKWLKNNKLKFINIIYTLMVVIVGWSIFKCTSLIEAVILLQNMFSINHTGFLNPDFFMTIELWLIFVFAILFSGFIQNAFTFLDKMFHSSKLYYGEIVLQIVLLSYSLLICIGGTYSAFLYAQF